MSRRPKPRSRALTACALGFGAVVLGSLVVAACSRGYGPPLRPRESLLEKTRSEVAYASPAVWRYHPRSEASLLARSELSDGTILYAGERGERWLFNRKTSGVRAAARLAPESLIAVLRLADGGWLFVGQSGTGYEAREPLGPFVRTSAPVDKLARVSAAGTSVVGVTRDGVLVQSADAAATWKPVGAPDVRYVDVMMADSSRGLALSLPEATWQTKDGGTSWAKLDVPSMGAIGFGWDDKSGVAVQTALSWLRWDPSGTPAFAPLGRMPSKARFKLPVRPERGPDANAMAEGRAIVIGADYLEIARADATPGAPAPTPGYSPYYSGYPSPSGSESWVLWRGRVGAKLQQRPVDALKGCQAVRLGGFDRFLYVACSRGTNGANQTYSFFRSDDGGKTFDEDMTGIEGRLGELELAVGAEGELSVTGVCPPQNSSRGCQPYGLYYRHKAPVDAGAEAGKPDAGKRAPHDAGTPDGGAKAKRPHDDTIWELAPSAAPALKGSALAIAFSPDGRTAFAVGRRTKGSSLVVFVSHDGGESYDAREIEQLEGDFDQPEVDNRWAQPPTSQSSVTSIGPAEDGTLAISLKSAGTTMLVVVDEEGRVVSLARAPGEATALGAVGSRAIAFSEGTRMAWESLDGGATWDPIGRLPAGGCPATGGTCSLPVRCHLGGCEIGTELSRLGWHGQADDDQGMLSPTDLGLSDIYDRKIGTPFSCTLDEKPWQALENVSQPPNANQAAIGKVAWFSLAQDERKGSASMYHATGGAKPKVETVQLLAPVTKPNDYAMTASVQVEGAAALRYAAPEQGTSSTLKNVEVTWDNLLEGKLVKTHVADLGPTSPGDWVRTGYGSERAQPNLLSIANGGLYLRIHYAARDAQPTVFLDGRTTTSTPDVTWPGSSPLGVRTEMAHVGSVHVPLLFVGSGVATVRARRAGAGWTFESFATGLAEPAQFGLFQSRDLAYVGQRSALQVTLYDPEGTRRANWLYPFRADGAVVDTPIALPTQADAGDKPSRCGNTTKADTARVIVPFQGGTRHPIVVTDSAEPMRVLLTGEAVMYGSPHEPCVAAYDAEVVNIDPSIGTPEQERAIVSVDDLEHSWLFRTVYTPTGETKIEYRVMSCRFDPTLDPPPEVFSLPGTKVRRAR